MNKVLITDFWYGYLLPFKSEVLTFSSLSAAIERYQNYKFREESYVFHSMYGIAELNEYMFTYLNRDNPDIPGFAYIKMRIVEPMDLSQETKD